MVIAIITGAPICASSRRKRFFLLEENNRPVDYVEQKKEIDEHAESLHMLVFPVTSDGNLTQASLSAEAAGAAVSAVTVAESALSAGVVSAPAAAVVAAAWRAK